jgi:large subunit ribosomal protein L21
MYAVVRTGGKQYRVEAGTTLVVEKLGGEPGSRVTFDRVLLVGDGDSVTVGNPTVSGATVSGTVVGESLGAKIVVFKFKQKVKYRRRTGHRQRLTQVRIDSITAGGKTVSAEELPAPRLVKGGAAPASAAKGKPAPKTRASTARRAEPTAAATERDEESATKAAEAKPARRPRTRAASAEPKKAADATSAGEEKPKPRARRAPKPKTESAKEE